MKISLNWLKKYVDTSKVSDDELVRLIGARLVEVEGVIDETHKYDKIYVVRVVHCEHIEGTHLSLCKIDTGGVKVPGVEYEDGELVQVMCGAPNVRLNMLAAWIAPGATVPASVHEDAPFVIGKRKMLGKYDSYGMLAGPDELDFGDDHSGIVEIDPSEAGPGVALTDVFDLNDWILDIENKSLTHRPDCFGLVGFAREVAGILGVKFSEPAFFLSRPDLKKVGSGKLSINIASSEICPRYTAVVLEKHGETKRRYLTWQDTILAKSGMRPIDPIVDATNYLMLLTGQPLHAFDYDKFVAVGGSKEPEIGVRLAREGEKLLLLDGKEIVLHCTDIVITSSDKPVALAGAMGGFETEIDVNTRNIIIEAATFSLYNLRKTQMAHGIFSEAITRFTKGQPPYQTMQVGMACAEMLADGFQVAEVADEYPKPEEQSVVKITTSEINGLLGTNYADDLIIRTLQNVGFVVLVKKGVLEVTAPAWRTDIHIKEDVIEEVGRLLGYDDIEPVLPRHATAEWDKMWEFKKFTRDVLSKLGANEALTYSFVSGRLMEKAGQDAKNAYRIVNSISPELQYVRQAIVPSLLDKAYMNQKLPVDRFMLFEINKVYQKAWGMNEEGVPAEKMRLGMVVAERKGTGVAYYHMKRAVEEYLRECGVCGVEFRELKSKATEYAEFEPKRAAEVYTRGGMLLGVVGEFKNSVRRNFKLAEYLAGAELDFDAILASRSERKVSNDFVVKNKEDVTVTTSESYAKTLAKLQAEHPEAVISPVGIYQPEGAEEKNITFHLEFF